MSLKVLQTIDFQIRLPQTFDRLGNILHPTDQIFLEIFHLGFLSILSLGPGGVVLPAGVVGVDDQSHLLWSDQ